jgi:hypothetical protein
MQNACKMCDVLLYAEGKKCIDSSAVNISLWTLKKKKFLIIYYKQSKEVTNKNIISDAVETYMFSTMELKYTYTYRIHDGLYEYNNGHCPLSWVCLLYTTFWEMALLWSSGDYWLVVIRLIDLKLFFILIRAMVGVKHCFKSFENHYVGLLHSIWLRMKLIKSSVHTTNLLM